jgi:DNA modification methylase
MGGDARYRLIRGDCRRVAVDLSAVDAIVTDPPYGISYKHSGCGRPPTGRRAGRRHATAIIGDDEPFDPAPWLDLGRPCLFLGANHFHKRLPHGGSWLCWDKTEGGKGPKDSFVDGEFAWCSVEGIKRNVIPHLCKGVCARKRGEDNGRRSIPTQKPIGSMRRLIDLMGLPEGSLILDPYMGVGSTIIAALELGHRAIGIEIDPRRYAIACDRVDAYWRAS